MESIPMSAQNQDSPSTLYPLRIMNYTFAALINLVTLLIGIAIGLILAPNVRTVSAQSASCVPSATVECVTPIMTVGSAGIGKLLSNQISSDQLTVNGYDILKLDNNLFSALVQARVITPAQAQSVVDASHPEKTLRFQPQQPSTPPAK
jgi:hypothetical protein